MIPRFIQTQVLESLQLTKKLLLIFGPRQTGKTTVLKQIQAKLQSEHKRTLYLNCDLEEDRRVVDTTALTPLRQLMGSSDIVLIDEAQRLTDPGLTLKIIYDQIPSVQVIATGSSSFHLKNRVSDALTGRYLDFRLYPFSFSELLATLQLSPEEILRKQQADTLLEPILTWGLYPEVYLQASPTLKERLLTSIIDSYLFKDILSFRTILHAQALVDLARALAYQIGNPVNENELASRLKIDRKTVVNYLDILEQTFVIIRVFPYSQNPRREIGRQYKVYFVDAGIRNGLIGDFNRLSIRLDSGFLWENFIIMERIKRAANRTELLNFNFWRSYSGAEVDLIERKGAVLSAFESKYQAKNLSRGAKIFTKEYKTPVTLINKNNYLEFL